MTFIIPFEMIIKHPERAFAPSFLNTEDGSDATCLGPLPHQIRGFLSSFHTMMPTTEAFPQCTACSDTVSKSSKLELYFSQKKVKFSSFKKFMVT